MEHTSNCEVNFGACWRAFKCGIYSDESDTMYIQLGTQLFGEIHTELWKYAK